MDRVKLRWILVAVLAAVLVRLPAITTLPLDSDEPIYMAASQEIAEGLRDKNAELILAPTLNREHPGLVKLLYGLSFVGLGEEPDLIARLATTRGLSMLAGLATVGLVAWVHPAAGLALATHTLHAKYSVQGYLDSLPLFWMSLAMIVGWRTRAEADSRGQILAAACWGAAVAGKWLHGLPGLVLLVVIPTWRGRLQLAVGALISMWILDPGMWMDPLDRVTEMLSAHQAYAGALDTPTHWLDPLRFMVSGGPAQWHPEAFSWSPDGIWFGLGVAGIVIRYRDSFALFLAAWCATPLLFLMCWSTRWPQHTMAVIVPVCLGVGLLFDVLVSRASRRFSPTGSDPPTSE
jgi:hypothetical protein